MSPQRITIHQFHFSTSEADAVTNHMRLIRDSLAEEGIGGEIFSVEDKSPIAFGIQKFSPSRLWNADLLLIHHSHGNPHLKTVLNVEVPKALVYHNITPDSFFRHDRYLADLCRLGRQQLALIRNQVGSSFAVSELNAQELREVGFENVQPFPLLDLPTDRKSLARVPSLSGPQILLFVGKLTPHKNQRLLIEAMYYLEQTYPGRYHLNLVGRGDAIYGAYLRSLAQMLGVGHVVDFLGAVSAATLSEQYASASAFVCPSLHEGFCVPLVEAMQAELPILALPIPGVRHTLGDSGIRVMTRKPHRFAAVIDSVLSHSAGLSAVTEGQWQRFQTLTTFQNRQRIREICRETVQQLRSRSPVKRIQKVPWFPGLRRVDKPA